jgi:RimJ/RimL family protein N-acetyltransferase
MVEYDISPIVETERLRLRRPRPTDAARVAMLANDFDIAKMTSTMPHPYDLDDARGFLERVDRSDPQRNAEFAIERDGELIGMLGFHPMDDGRCELGYWLGRPYWGRGFATEAVRAAMRWARGDWGRRFVIARHFADNPASGEVLCKSDFLYTGEVALTPSRARGEAAASRTMVWLA